MCFVLAGILAAQQDSLKVRSQYPSPMVEHSRAHGRVSNDTVPGIRLQLGGVLPKPISLFFRKPAKKTHSFDVVLNFHSAPFITEHAVADLKRPLIGLTINLGGGSSAYNNPFVDSTMFPRLLDSLRAAVRDRLNRKISINRVYLCGFSAGYGAVRRILSTAENYAAVDGVLLLDGIHASYVPERTVLAEGGRIDSTHLETFLNLARDASSKKSRKRFIITHSEVFPGTFVSTTESTDYLLDKLGMVRTPTLKWGPQGMQQTSRAERNHFAVWGFAGNSGIDHGDHLHAMPAFLKSLIQQ